MFGEGSPLPLSATKGLTSSGFTAKEVFRNGTTLVVKYRNPDDAGDDMFPMDVNADVSSLSGDPVTVTLTLTAEDGTKEELTEIVETDESLSINFDDVDGKSFSGTPLKELVATFTSTDSIALASDKVHVCHKPLTTPVPTTTTMPVPTTTTTGM